MRHAFRRNTETAKRRVIVVGTTNRFDSLPNDPSGNRRFVPINLNAATQAVEDYLDEHRDQLWAEALVRHSAGVTPRMPRTLMPHAAVAAETHRNRDTILEDALDAALPPDWEGTLEEAAHKIGLLAVHEAGAKLSMRDSKRLGAALRGSGREMHQVKVGGIKRRIWKPAVPRTA